MSGYTYIRHGHRVAHTIEITENVLADVDEGGLIIGIESLIGPVTEHHLIAVLTVARILDH